MQIGDENVIGSAVMDEFLEMRFCIIH